MRSCRGEKVWFSRKRADWKWYEEQWAVRTGPIMITIGNDWGLFIVVRVV